MGTCLRDQKKSTGNRTLKLFDSVQHTYDYTLWGILACKRKWQTVIEETKMKPEKQK
jgi:hypothetical protein